jgi:hypothetical protein
MKIFAKSSPCSNNHLPLTLPACLPLLGLPSALTFNLLPFLCFYLALWLASLLLSGSSSFFLPPPWLSSPWLLVLHGPPPGPLLLSLLLPAPFLSGSFSIPSSGHRCEMLRNGGRLRARNMRGAGGWDAMGYASTYFSLHLPVNAYLSPILMYI